MNIKEVSIVAHGYLSKHPNTKMKQMEYEGTTFIFFGAPIQSSIIYRVGANWRRLDTNRDGSVVLLYHEFDEGVPVASESRDLQKIVAHWPLLLKAAPVPADRYRKGLVFVEDTDKREILVGMSMTHRVLYESNKYIKENIKYAELEDVDVTT